MATLLAQNEWHGNPRPRPAYAWTEFVEQVEAPATHIGLVPVHNSGWSLVPWAEKDADPTGATDIAGPLATVEVSLAGPFPFGTVINWVFTGDVSGAHADTYTVSYVNGLSPEEVLTDISIILAADVGADSVVAIDADDARKMSVTAAGTNETFTVTTWTVTPPA